MWIGEMQVLVLIVRVLNLIIIKNLIQKLKFGGEEYEEDDV